MLIINLCIVSGHVDLLTGFQLLRIFEQLVIQGHSVLGHDVILLHCHVHMQKRLHFRGMRESQEGQEEDKGTQ